MSSEPPLGSGLACLCAAEFGADAVPVPAKVVFTWDCARPCRRKLTVSVSAVNMQSPFIQSLPKRRLQMRPHVSPDVDEIHFLARASTNIIKDVEVLEVSTEVVSEINAVGRIAARCSPVGGVSLQWSHSGQT